MTTNTLTRRATAFLLLTAVLALASACGDDDDDTDAAGQQPSTTGPAVTATTLAVTSTTGATGTTAAAGANRITIQSFAFSGLDSATAGDTWTVANQDSAPHTVSAVDGSFRWDVAGGETKTFTRRVEPGSYPVRCDIHPARMTGTLVVR